MSAVKLCRPCNSCTVVYTNYLPSTLAVVLSSEEEEEAEDDSDGERVRVSRPVEVGDKTNPVLNRCTRTRVSVSEHCRFEFFFYSRRKTKTGTKGFEYVYVYICKCVYMCVRTRVYLYRTQMTSGFESFSV